MVRDGQLDRECETFKNKLRYRYFRKPVVESPDGPLKRQAVA
jgi:hypothetical protein